MGPTENGNQSFEVVETEETDLKRKGPKKKSKLNAGWITSIVTVVVFAAVVGSGGGYYLYNYLHPEKDSVVLSSDDTPTAEKMQKSIDGNTVSKDYKDKAYQVLNYAFYKQASYKYSLSVTTGKTHALIADQTIKSACLVTPECDYFENLSSGFTSTAFRFFDKKDGTNSIESMKAKKESEWETMTPEPMSYDQYIQEFGKLYKGSYYVTYDTSDSSKTVPDVYLSDQEADYKAALKTGSKASKVTGISIYNMNQKTVTESTIDEIDGGYQIRVTFDVKKGACSYFKAQMKTTGGVDVSFNSSTITYELDRDLNLIHGKTVDGYKTVGVQADQTLDIYYYHNESEASFGGKMVLVPKTHSTETFKAYELISEEA